MTRMDIYKKSLDLHKKLKGKIKVVSKRKVKTKDDLSLLYTPGVAGVSLEVAKNIQSARYLTIKGNSVAVVSDGSAVLGLGDIGPEASLPVMEGKCLLFKEFAGVDAFPIVLGTKDVEEIVQTVKNISPGFGGINLEDISAPRCFEIEESLQDIAIPVFHDDQHGTAIVVLAALTNALQVVGKNLKNVKVVIMGAGAAGITTAKILGVRELVLIDSKGVVTKDRRDLNKYKGEIVMKPYYSGASNIEEAFRNADVFVGVSGKGKLAPALIKSMSKDQ